MRRGTRSHADKSIPELLTELDLAVHRVLQQARRIAERSVEGRPRDLNMREAQDRLRREIDRVEAEHPGRPGQRRPWRS